MKLSEVLEYLEPNERAKVVRAVNSHDALVAALQDMLNAYTNTATASTNTRMAAVNAADAALALAVNNASDEKKRPTLTRPRNMLQAESEGRKLKRGQVQYEED